MSIPRVLLADDHKAMLEKAVRVLKEEVKIVGTVGDGQSLLEAAARLQPVVVVLDISMPVLSGIEAAKRLRQ